MIENLLHGFLTIATWTVVLAIFAGIAIGYFVGAMPGLSSAAGMALLVPISFTMPPVVAICLLVTTYAAAEYGGCITAITVNTPGTPGALATVLDGYQFTKRGEPAKALGISMIASTIGGLLSYLVLVAFTEPIAEFGITLGAPEFALLGILALSIVSGLLGRSRIKGAMSAAFGLLIATMGIDPLGGWPRFDFGSDYLIEGIPFVPVLIGLCAVSEAFDLLGKPLRVRQTVRVMSGRLPSLREIIRLRMTFLRGTVVGIVVGILPGAGSAVASIISYNMERRFSKTPEKFGTGVLEGVAAPEAANNASVGGSLVPLLSLGIPGSNSAAILIGALVMQGILPGPLLMSRHADLVYAVFAALIAGALIMFVFGMALIPVWTRVLRVPEGVMAPIVLAIAIVGTYAYGNSFGNVMVTLAFGVLGLFMRHHGFPYVPLILAVVLGEMIEINFRRALMLSKGSLDIFVSRPISFILLALIVAIVFFPLVRKLRRRTAKTPGHAANA